MAISILLVFIIIQFMTRRPTEAQERMGCFSFNYGNTALSALVQGVVGSIEECIQRCKTRTATYAGIRNGFQCYCGDSHNHTVNGEKLSDSSCTTRCSDQKKLCGGQYSIVIYSVCNRGRYLDNINDQYNCDASCNCKDKHICLYRNGSCPVNCEPGWTGEACNCKVLGTSRSTATSAASSTTRSDGCSYQACVFGSGSDCAFPCSCAYNAACNANTGVCPGRCKDGLPRPPGNETAFDWRGPGCRTGNVAYGKPATLSGSYETQYADRAVDGILPPVNLNHTLAQGEYCILTRAMMLDFGWWQVDLEGFYSIHNLTIFNGNLTDGTRTSHLQITVSNSSNFMGAVVCTFYLGPLVTGRKVTLQCASRLIGRYVRLQRTGGIEPSIINVCEVVVMGYEIVVPVCSNCLSPCDDLASIVGCIKCSGFLPPHCMKPCHPGSYGVNCASSCFDHHCQAGPTECDHVTGGCTDGCENWYLGDKCIEHIQERTIGGSTTVSGAAVSSSQVSVTWRGDDTIIANQSRYYGYQVQYKARNSLTFLPGANVSHVHGEDQYRVIISGLLHNTAYMLRVYEYRHHGDLFQLSNSSSEEVMIMTPCNVAAPDPVNIVSITLNISSRPFTIDVKWQTAPSGCDSIISIQVLYRLLHDDVWMSNDVINPATSTMTSINVNASGVWEVKIRTVNNNVISSDSTTGIFALLDTSCQVVSKGYLSILFAVLFGVAAVIHCGFLFYCIRSKILRQQNKAPAVKSEDTPRTDATYVNTADVYEGLDPSLRAPEGPYTEIHMVERQST